MKAKEEMKMEDKKKKVGRAHAASAAPSPSCPLHAGLRRGMAVA
jgi:hypothetical protein